MTLVVLHNFDVLLRTWRESAIHGDRWMVHPITSQVYFFWNFLPFSKQFPGRFTHGSYDKPSGMVITIRLWLMSSFTWSQTVISPSLFITAMTFLRDANMKTCLWRTNTHKLAQTVSPCLVSCAMWADWSQNYTYCIVYLTSLLITGNSSASGFLCLYLFLFFP